jgi:spermidine synthase
MSRFGIPYTKMLYHKKSPYQDIKIVESETIGRTLLLDNIFMICEKTEENYHEMMVHPSVQVLL